ncbi:MAG: DNA-3-methyladenine glycosylase family protein [Candidatus Micrarchaeia archaeon]|jgi:N-glycosylase/DNA lyase
MLIRARDFNLRYTIESGQPLTFFADYSFSGKIAHLKYPMYEGFIEVEAEQKGRDCTLTAASENYSKAELSREVKERLGLNDKINEIYKSISTDAFIKDAIKRFYGMRITKNELWQTTLSFIVSQFNSIKRIRKIMLCFIERFGKGYFPRWEKFAGANASEIACGAGFRASYIKEVAERYDPDVFSNYSMLSYNEAKSKLMEYKGIGDKVADCILLMGYKKLEAFPIDTWVKRVLVNVYKPERESTKELHQFASSRWGNFAGYAEHYLYWYGREIAFRSFI